MEPCVLYTPMAPPVAWFREFSPCAALAQDSRVAVESMAQAAGVSRQHLSREFRERIGVPPKLYSRLARFHGALAYVGRPSSVDWARAAAESGYADQSHMIAEFRQFSGLTPDALVSRYWFHPFIERARDRRRPVGAAL